jgi:hypothetical protein
MYIHKHIAMFIVLVAQSWHNLYKSTFYLLHIGWHNEQNKKNQHNENKNKREKKMKKDHLLNHINLDKCTTF